MAVLSAKRLAAQQQQRRLAKNARRARVATWTFVSLGALAIAAAATLLIAPTQLANEAVDDDSAGVFASPRDQIGLKDLIGTDVQVEVREDDVTLPRWLGLEPRTAVLSLTWNFRVQDDELGSLETVWDVYLPKNALQWRAVSPEVNDVVTTGDKRTTRFGMTSWQEIGRDRTSIPVMPVLLQAEKGGTWLVHYGFEVRVSAPRLTRGLDDNDGWVESWKVGWTPPRDSPLIASWPSVGSDEQHGNQDWALDTNYFVKEPLPTRESEVVLALCPSCHVVRTYGDVRATGLHEYTLTGALTDETSIEWSTPWMPWSYSTPFIWTALGLLVATGASFFTERRFDAALRRLVSKT